MSDIVERVTAQQRAERAVARLADAGARAERAENAAASWRECAIKHLRRAYHTKAQLADLEMRYDYLDRTARHVAAVKEPCSIGREALCLLRLTLGIEDE